MTQDKNVNDRADAYAATDAETTDLNPGENYDIEAGEHPTGGQLLELSVLIVDVEAPYTVADEVGFHVILKHRRDEVFALANEYVQDMHTKTGLWDKVEDGVPYAEADLQLLAFLQKHSDTRRGLRVLGNSIRLDMNFLERFLPQSAAWMHYRFFDISGFAHHAHIRYGVPYYEKKLAHTARGDIIESIAELRHIDEGIEKYIEKSRVPF